MKTIFQGSNNPLMTSEKEYKIKTMYRKEIMRTNDWKKPI